MSTLELRHVRCFLAVARHLHFARAADELGVPPPSVTRQIQEAESLLGARLFHRTKRSVSLTAAGVAYQTHALAALDQLARGETAAHAAERGEIGRIEIGYVASAAYTGVLQNTVRAFRERHPRVEIGAKEIVMDQVFDLLETGAVNVAFVRPPMQLPDGIETATVFRDAFVLALPSESALCELASVASKQLRDETFVLPEQEFGTLEVARRGRFTPNLGPRPGTLAAVLAVVSMGGRVAAIVPQSLMECVTVPGVEYRMLAGKPVLSEVAMLYRRHERAPAVREFLAQALSPARGDR
ncbi:LysR family transcriptional regulator [Paraburkholderia sp.]|uniref:LysR family transcriptional regulator n=1 Tax=Paraburkholderia sp. TaxID=1926495 RepID=UPI00239D3DE5|nr:LysR family transcriptional regulator [Paraburkholderia sp.]MDE1179865.1 LysR family transcriptional regulator [Paraburkholderia sp.]